VPSAALGTDCPVTAAGSVCTTVMPALFALLLALTVLLPASDAMPAIEADIVHQRVDGRDLHLDFMPPVIASGPSPVLVWVHGGGWRAGHRRDNHEGMRGFAKLGYASISVEYRLSSEATYPAQLDDICSALRWIVAQAQARSLDPRRVALLGGSAGGHLVLLTGFHGRIPVGMRIGAIINIAGPTNLSFALSLPAGDDALRASSGMDSRQLVAALLGSDDRTDKIYGEASPLTWVRRDVPPVLTLQGRDDLIVPPVQAMALHAALRAVGARERLVLVDGGHDFTGWPEVQRNAAFLGIIGFLAENLR
jgi:acetyl esterase/lipase